MPPHPAPPLDPPLVLPVIGRPMGAPLNTTIHFRLPSDLAVRVCRNVDAGCDDVLCFDVYDINEADE